MDWITCCSWSDQADYLVGGDVDDDGGSGCDDDDDDDDDDGSCDDDDDDDDDDGGDCGEDDDDGSYFHLSGQPIHGYFDPQMTGDGLQRLPCKGVGRQGSSTQTRADRAQLHGDGGVLQGHMSTFIVNNFNNLINNKFILFINNILFILFTFKQFIRY